MCESRERYLTMLCNFYSSIWIQDYCQTEFYVNAFMTIFEQKKIDLYNKSKRENACGSYFFFDDSGDH